MLECEPVHIEDGETLKVTIDTSLCNLDEAYEAYNQVCKCFPKNRIIGLFSGMTLVKEIEEDG